MKNEIEILRQRHGTHKAVSVFLGVSYTRYNEWRWEPEKMPAYAKKLIELAAKDTCPCTTSSQSSETAVQ